MTASKTICNSTPDLDRRGLDFDSGGLYFSRGGFNAN